MDLVSFFNDHQKRFPTLWILVQCVSSMQVVDVGCEQFFGLSGYFSSPRWTNLGVQRYENLAMLSALVHKIYIDYGWVAKKYMRHSKQKLWVKENDNESIKYWNLEALIDAEYHGQKPYAPLTMADFERSNCRLQM